MAFAPRFEESGETGIIDNLLIVIERDLPDYLNGFYPPAGTLPPLAVMTEGEDTSFAYPLLIAGVESSSSEDHGEYLRQELRVGMGLVVKDTSVKAVRKRAAKYVRSLKAVLWKASARELFPDLDDTLDCVLDIDHRYLRHGQKGDEITQPVEIELRFRFGET